MKKLIIIAIASLLGTAAFAQPKFAHVNFAELVQLMPEADQARATMAASSKEAQDTYQSMVEEFQKKYTDYQQKAASLTGAIKESKERELTEIQQRIQEFQQNIQQELQEQQEKLMAPLYKKAQETVSKLAKEAGYVFVFDKTSILYIDDAQSTDITPEARKILGIADDRTLESLQAELQAQAQQQ